MTEGRSREVAVDLMMMALPLLDAAGESLAAARLRHALDAIAPEPEDVGKDEAAWRTGDAE